MGQIGSKKPQSHSMLRLCVFRIIVIIIPVWYLSCHNALPVWRGNSQYYSLPSLVFPLYFLSISLPQLMPIQPMRGWLALSRSVCKQLWHRSIVAMVTVAEATASLQVYCAVRCWLLWNVLLLPPAFIGIIPAAPTLFVRLTPNPHISFRPFVSVSRPISISSILCGITGQNSLVFNWLSRA